MSKKNKKENPARTRELYYKEDGKKIVGAPKDLRGTLSWIYGDATHITGKVSKDMEGDVSHLSGNVGRITGNVTNLAGDVSNIFGCAMDVCGDVSCIEGDVTNIYGDVGHIYGNISNISGCVDYIRGNVSGLYGHVTHIEANMDTSGIVGKVRFIARFMVLPKLSYTSSDLHVTAFLADNNLYFTIQNRTYNEDYFLNYVKERQNNGEYDAGFGKAIRKTVKMAHKIVKNFRLADPKTNQ
jgi:hypothetical protein